MTPPVKVTKITRANSDGDGSRLLPGRTDVDTNSAVLRPGSIGGLRTYKPRELQFKIHALLYGEPGIGKTHLCGTAADVECLRPILVINVEDGAKTLQGAYPDNNDIEIVTPRTFGQHQKILDDLYEKGHRYGFKTIIYDNMTEGQRSGIEYQFDSDKLSTDFTEFVEATWQNHGWNRSAEQMRRLVRTFRLLPQHTIFVAWRKDYSKPKAKVEVPESWGPAFSKAVAAEIPGMFDDVWYLKWAMLTNEKTKKQEKTRVLQTVGSPTVVAKSRAGMHKLPDIIRDPTMHKICEHWKMI